MGRKGVYDDAINFSDGEDEGELSAGEEGVASEDDEDIDSDEADGIFGRDADASDSDGEDDEGDQKAADGRHQQMLRAATGRSAAGAAAPEPKRPQTTELGREADGHVASDRTKLSVNALLDSLKSTSKPTKAVAALQRRAGGAGDATSVVPQAAAARIERAAAYGSTSKELTHEWQATVKRNREADQLQFSQGRGVRQRIGTGVLTHSFAASTALETEIESILQEEGLNPPPKKKKGMTGAGDGLVEDSLARGPGGGGSADPERVALAAKRRAALHDEQKRYKRLKRIKSRKFRKLAKKDREKDEAKSAAELGSDDDGEAADFMREKEARNRAEERMTQRHKNSSKWVQRQLALQHRKEEEEADGGEGVTESRQAVAQQLSISKKLLAKAKQQGKIVEDDEDDDAWLKASRADLEAVGAAAAEEAARSASSPALWADPGELMPPQLLLLLHGYVEIPRLQLFDANNRSHTQAGRAMRVGRRRVWRPPGCLGSSLCRRPRQASATRHWSSSGKLTPPTRRSGPRGRRPLESRQRMQWRLLSMLLSPGLA